MTDSDASLGESEAFQILENDRRRELVARLDRDRASEPVAVSDLAREISDQEAGGEGEGGERYKSVYVSLKQRHLPRLADERIVEYDAERNEVEPGPRLDEVVAYLADPPPRRRRAMLWPLLVSVVGIAVILMAAARVPVFSALEPGVWALVFLASSAVASAYMAVAGERA